MRKLTDDELSLVLSEQAVGKLVHSTFRSGDCGCVAGAVVNISDLALGCPVEALPPEASEISDAISNEMNRGFRLFVYPPGPEALLDLLAEAGL